MNQITQLDDLENLSSALSNQDYVLAGNILNQNDVIQMLS